MTICAKKDFKKGLEQLCLYTYGSPSGDKRWVKTLQVPYYRFQNNNDVVCRVPFGLWVIGIMERIYTLDTNDKVVKMNIWKDS